MGLCVELGDDEAEKEKGKECDGETVKEGEDERTRMEKAELPSPSLGPRDARDGEFGIAGKM